MIKLTHVSKLFPFLQSKTEWYRRRAQGYIAQGRGYAFSSVKAEAVYTKRRPDVYVVNGVWYILPKVAAEITYRKRIYGIKENNWMAEVSTAVATNAVYTKRVYKSTAASISTTVYRYEIRPIKQRISAEVFKAVVTISSIKSEIVGAVIKALPRAEAPGTGAAVEYALLAPYVLQNSLGKNLLVGYWI